MGGFLLFNRSNQINSDLALNIFKSKKQKIVKDICCGDYRLITFNKRSFENQNLFQFDNEDFVASIGTPVYKNLAGEKAAAELYNDFKNKVNIDFSNFFGNFCYIIYVNRKLFLFNDYNGIYHVYCDESNQIFSNSFLAVSSFLKNKSISKQGLYEYVFYGATFGSDTIIENIKQLTNKKIIQLIPEFLFRNKEFNHVDVKNNYYKYEEWIENVSKDLINYFKIITENYNEFSLGLSGGFDSRLILSLLLKCGNKPLIYTNGNPNSAEVRISKSICEAFELDFQNFYENETLEFDKNYSNEMAEEKFISDDGFNHFGIFYSFLSKDLEISRKTKTNLNGMGGEIYRNRWNLPDKKININYFMKSQYLKNFQKDLVTDKFDKSIFFEKIKRKIINGLDLKISNLKMSPALINIIYPIFKMRYWAGRTCSKINQYCFSLLPFSEPYLYLKSIYIPNTYKIAGKFEAALIKKINPELAKFNSNYTFNFFDGPDLRSLLVENIKIYTPVYINQFISKNIKHFFRSKRSISNPKLYIAEEMGKLVFTKEMLIKEYINLDKITTKDMYSRVLTVEYFIINCM